MNNPMPVSAPKGVQSDTILPRISTMHDVTATPSGKLLARFSSADDARRICAVLPGTQVLEVLCTQVGDQWVTLDQGARQVFYVADSHPLEEPVCPVGCVTDGNFTYPLKPETGSLAYFTLEHVDEGLLVANLLAAIVQQTVTPAEPDGSVTVGTAKPQGSRPSILGLPLDAMRLGVPDGHQQIDRRTSEDGSWGE